MLRRMEFLDYLKQSNICSLGNNLVFEKKKLKDNFFFSKYA